MVGAEQTRDFASHPFCRVIRIQIFNLNERKGSKIGSKQKCCSSTFTFIYRTFTFSYSCTLYLASAETESIFVSVFSFLIVVTIVRILLFPVKHYFKKKYNVYIFLGCSVLSAIISANICQIMVVVTFEDHKGVHDHL